MKIIVTEPHSTSFQRTHSTEVFIELEGQLKQLQVRQTDCDAISRSTTQSYCKVAVDPIVPIGRSVPEGFRAYRLFVIDIPEYTIPVSAYKTCAELACRSGLDIRDVEEQSKRFADTRCMVSELPAHRTQLIDSSVKALRLQGASPVDDPHTRGFASPVIIGMVGPYDVDPIECEKGEYNEEDARGIQDGLGFVGFEGELTEASGHEPTPSDTWKHLPFTSSVELPELTDTHLALQSSMSWSLESYRQADKTIEAFTQSIAHLTPSSAWLSSIAPSTTSALSVGSLASAGMFSPTVGVMSPPSLTNDAKSLDSIMKDALVHAALPVAGITLTITGIIASYVGIRALKEAYQARQRPVNHPLEGIQVVCNNNPTYNVSVIETTHQ